MTRRSYNGAPNPERDAGGALPIAPKTMVRLRPDADLWRKQQGVEVEVLYCRWTPGQTGPQWLVGIRWPAHATTQEAWAGFFEAVPKGKTNGATAPGMNGTRAPSMPPVPLPAPLPAAEPAPEAPAPEREGPETPADRMRRLLASRTWGGAQS